MKQRDVSVDASLTTQQTCYILQHLSVLYKLLGGGHCVV